MLYTKYKEHKARKQKNMLPKQEMKDLSMKPWHHQKGCDIIERINTGVYLCILLFAWLLVLGSNFQIEHHNFLFFINV